MSQDEPKTEPTRRRPPSATNIYFNVVKSTAIGSIIGASVGAVATLAKSSWAAKKLVIPNGNELTHLFNNKASIAVGAAFGFFGLLHALNAKDSDRPVEFTL